MEVGPVTGSPGASSAPSRGHLVTALAPLAAAEEPPRCMMLSKSLHGEDVNSRTSESSGSASLA